ncbi:MAG: glucose-6-phosphate isomerase [Alphaproteobacteria bacterium]|nr:glucose-6-phosphate isomerase [Alphaproteobacteria bacterium]
MEKPVYSDPIWTLLKEQHAFLSAIHMRDLFDKEKDRFKQYSLTIDNILIDFSKNILNQETLSLLVKLATQAGLDKAIQDMFQGKRINATENRAVLHHALRMPENSKLVVEGQDIIPLINQTRNKMINFSEQIRNGIWLGSTQKKIKHIVNIGIGGSDLGPKMVVEALAAYVDPILDFHFVSNVDVHDLGRVLEKINPENTIFIVVSKTFTTQETLLNAKTAWAWLYKYLGDHKLVSKHFIAVTCDVNAAVKFGISDENIFQFWEWVGGRYSLWSAVGLIIMCAIGKKSFMDFLAGAYAMDQHFQSAPFTKNAPVLLALLGIWYINFFDYKSQAILPYHNNLRYLPAYLQQADMESNGKSVDQQGNYISYNTAPVIWGEPGTNGQHAFYQLLHQGTQIIPADFIGFAQGNFSEYGHQEILLSHFFAQTRAMMIGKTENEVKLELEETILSNREKEMILPHKIFYGNRPTNTILCSALTPYNLGMLIALYEQKIFSQGIIWNIYSFDQWGVELGKKLAGKILENLQQQKIPKDYDSSTQGLIEFYYKNLSKN